MWAMWATGFPNVLPSAMQSFDCQGTIWHGGSPLNITAAMSPLHYNPWLLTGIYVILTALLVLVQLALSLSNNPTNRFPKQYHDTNQHK